MAILYNNVVGVDVQYTDGEMWGADISPNEVYVAMGQKTDDGDNFAIYKRGTTGWDQLPMPDGLITGDSFGGTSFSPDGKYLAVGIGSSVYVYSINYVTDTFTQVFSVAYSGSVVWRVRFGSGYLAVAKSTSPGIRVYAVNSETDTFTVQADLPSLPDVVYKSVDWDGASNTLVASGGAVTVAYSVSGGVFSKMADLPNLPVSDSYRADISPDGTYIAISYVASPFLAWYKRSGSNWVKMANPSTMPTSPSWSCRWSVDSDYLYVGQESGTSLFVYNLSGDVLTLVSDYYNDVIVGDPLEIVQSSSKRYLVAAIYLDGLIIWEKDQTTEVDVAISVTHGDALTLNKLKVMEIGSAESIGGQMALTSSKIGVVGISQSLGCGIECGSAVDVSVGSPASLGDQVNCLSDKSVAADLIMDVGGVIGLVDAKYTYTGLSVESGDVVDAVINAIRYQGTVLSHGAEDAVDVYRSTNISMSDSVGLVIDLVTEKDRSESSTSLSLGYEISVEASVLASAVVGIEVGLGFEVTVERAMVVDIDHSMGIGFEVESTSYQGAESDSVLTLGVGVAASGLKRSFPSVDISEGMDVDGQVQKMLSVDALESVGAEVDAVTLKSGTGDLSASLMDDVSVSVSKIATANVAVNDADALEVDVLTSRTTIVQSMTIGLGLDVKSIIARVRAVLSSIGVSLDANTTKQSLLGELAVIVGDSAAVSGVKRVASDVVHSLGIGSNAINDTSDYFSINRVKLVAVKQGSVKLVGVKRDPVILEVIYR